MKRGLGRDWVGLMGYRPESRKAGLNAVGCAYREVSGGEEEMCGKAG